MDFALGLLEARGDVAPERPGGRGAGAVRHQGHHHTHEVGHTLAAQAQLRASTVVSRSAAATQRRSPKTPRPLGVPVMDYNAFNLPLAGERPSTLNNTTLGPATTTGSSSTRTGPSPWPTRRPEAQARIACRPATPTRCSRTPTTSRRPTTVSVHIVNRFDLGGDPLAYFLAPPRAICVSCGRWVQSPPQLGDDLTRARRVLRQRLPLAAGEHHARRQVRGRRGHHPRAAGHRAACGLPVPVDPAKQLRCAAQFTSKGVSQRRRHSASSRSSRQRRPGLQRVGAHRAGRAFQARCCGCRHRGSRPPDERPAHVRACSSCRSTWSPAELKGIITLAEVYGTLRDARCGANSRPAARSTACAVTCSASTCGACRCCWCVGGRCRRPPYQASCATQAATELQASAAYRGRAAGPVESRTGRTCSAASALLARPCSPRWSTS